MDIVLLLLIVVLLFVILARINTKFSGVESLKKSIEQLNQQASELNKQISLLRWQKEIKEEKKPADEKPETIIKPAPVIEKIPEKKIAEPESKPLQKEPVAPPRPVVEEKRVITEERKIPSQPQQIYEPQESWFQKWLRNNPDMEKFIGENLINKIGIAVLILGIVFFVKYAIDENWINEVGRVCIGLFCGLILIVLAHRLRNNYRSFSSVLVGGGLTVFYFTIAFAFHQYSLLSQPAAFIIMVVITAFAVILSIFYDRIELGILATIGGFITPFLVSTGKGNYIVLFTYLCILNSGLIALAFYKRWHILNFIAFVFTVLIYGGWIVSNTDNASFPYKGTFLFGTVFYLMFITMNIIQHTKRLVKLNAFDVVLLLLTNFGYYVAGIYLLQQWGVTEYKGLFTASIGVLNLILAAVFFKRKNIDKNFVLLLIGLTISFISLTAPVQLKGNYITVFWATETVLLFWLYQKSFIRLLKIAALIVTVLMLVSLLMDWFQIYAFNYTLIPVIVNKGFTTTFFSALTASLMVYLLRKEADTFYFNTLNNARVKLFYTIVAIALFFMSGALEINYQFSRRFTGAGLEYTYLQMYMMGFFLLLFYIVKPLKIETSTYVRIGTPLILFLLYTFNIPNSYNTEKLMLAKAELKPHFIAHWVGIIFLVVLIWSTIQFVRRNGNLKNILNAFSWITVIAIVILLSTEIMHLYIWLIYKNSASLQYAENLYNKAGLSIVWGISSFILIWLGMRHSFKPLRIIALVLFGITLIKLFVFDIRNISPAGKIIAFILLGVLLLIVSFMYQRLKKLIIDNPAKE